VKPKCVVTTFEGHAWERVTAFRVKNNNIKIQWLAYQHGNLFRLQHSLRRSVGRHFNPDAIFCSGFYSLLNLTSSIRMPEVKLFNMGSPRVNGNSSLLTNVDGDTNKNTYLVMPDGIESEIIYLYKFILNCASARSDCNFIFRLHPSISWDRLVKSHKELDKSLPNIEIDQCKGQWIG
jgi:hypothetical protein